MSPEQATAEAFARLMEDKRGGKWSPVVRGERDVAVSRARKSRRSLTAPQDDGFMSGVSDPRGVAPSKSTSKGETV